MTEELNPKERVRQAKLKLLSDIEGKHRVKPSLHAIAFAVAATLIEATIAFVILQPEGQPIAIVGALFPVILLWTMANYQADHVNLPKQYDKLVEQYDNGLDL